MYFAGVSSFPDSVQSAASTFWARLFSDVSTMIEV